MTTPNMNRASHGIDPNGQARPNHPANDAFWWPFRSFSKALLQTQRNANTYLDANRRLIDEMRTIIRKQQDLAVDLSDSVFKAMTKPNAGPAGGQALNSVEVNQVFDLAVSRMRELGEAWIDVQVRSLDAMRNNVDTGSVTRKPVERLPLEAEAA